MKRTYYILTLLTLCCFSACQKDMPVGGSTGSDVEITLSNKGFIQFDSNIGTRGKLIESDYIPGSMGVYGYQYDFDRSWSGRRAICIPNVFWNGTDAARLPLEVKETNGYYSYSAANADADNAGQIEWEGGRYAFYAYYPYEHESLTPISMTAEGAPYLEYTVNKTDATKHADVMTGGVHDITAAGTENTVTFEMRHRLAGVDVEICNAYEYTYESGQDADGNPIYTTVPVTVEIHELTVKFENLRYDKGKFFLEQDKTIPSIQPVFSNVSGNQEATYRLIGSGSNSGVTMFEAPYSTVNNSEVTASTGTSMTFIPQEEDDLTVIATARYRKRLPDGTYVTNEKDEDGNPLQDANGYSTIEKVTTFGQALVNGSRYYVLLNFTSAAVTINIDKAASWDEIELEDEFEFV